MNDMDGYRFAFPIEQKISLLAVQEKLDRLISCERCGAVLLAENVRIHNNFHANYNVLSATSAP